MQDTYKNLKQIVFISHQDHYRMSLWGPPITTPLNGNTYSQWKSTIPYSVNGNVHPVNVPYYGNRVRNIRKSSLRRIGDQTSQILMLLNNNGMN